MNEDLKNLILEFHDLYNVCEKRKRINNIIKLGYELWLNDSTRWSLFFYRNQEYEAKRDIFLFQTNKIFITNASKWKSFLKYFVCVEAIFRGEGTTLSSVWGEY